MKVELSEKEIRSYVLTVKVEVKGKEYTAELSYDTHDGYEVNFLNADGRLAPTPKWATELEENDENGSSLGFILESKIGGWWKWEEESK